MPTGSHSEAPRDQLTGGCEPASDLAAAPSPTPLERRRVRSYVRRSGRMTAAQRRALDRAWPRYGVTSDVRVNLSEVFGRQAPRVLEIGFGMGEALVELAVRHPDWDFLGVEVYEPGVGRALNRLAALEVENVRLVADDAAIVLERCIPPASLSAVLLFFPDPWPKKRHRKRRLVQPPFVSQVASVLEPGGVLQLATDWEDYARQMLAVIEAQPGFRNRYGPARFAPGPLDRPQTKFQCRGERLGHRIRDLVFDYQPSVDHG